jgi:hypothetical protein
MAVAEATVERYGGLVSRPEDQGRQGRPLCLAAVDRQNTVGVRRLHVPPCVTAVAVYNRRGPHR